MPPNTRCPHRFTRENPNLGAAPATPWFQWESAPTRPPCGEAKAPDALEQEASRAEAPLGPWPLRALGSHSRRHAPPHWAGGSSSKHRLPALPRHIHSPFMSALVTGATGLVGFHIVEALRRAGERPRVLVRSPEKARAILGDTCELFPGDVTDPASVLAACRGMDQVFHAAGHPEQWLKDPSTFDRVNVGGTRNVVTACQGSGVKRLIYTSTIDVFEGRAHQLFDESVLAQTPKGTAYERSKQEADRVVVQALESGVDAVFLHPSGVYGPGPAQSRGLNDFVKDLKANKVPSLLPGGVPVVFGRDVGEAHVRAAARAARGARFIVSERFLTLQALAAAACKALGKKRVPPVVPLGVAKVVSAATEAMARLTGKPPLIPAGQLHFLQWNAIPDATRARTELGMEFTTLEDGLAALVATL